MALENIQKAIMLRKQEEAKDKAKKNKLISALSTIGGTVLGAATGGLAAPAAPLLGMAVGSGIGGAVGGAAGQFATGDPLGGATTLFSSMPNAIAAYGGGGGAESSLPPVEVSPVDTSMVQPPQPRLSVMNPELNYQARYSLNQPEDYYDLLLR